MPVDSVIAEVRAAREAYAARFGFDIMAMVRDLREREQAGGRELVRLPPRPAITAVPKPTVPQSGEASPASEMSSLPDAGR